MTAADDSLNGLELAVRLRTQADTNPLAAAMWYRLIYAADPDAEAERIRQELAPMLEAVTEIVKAAKPAIRIWYDAAGPN